MTPAPIARVREHYRLRPCGVPATVGLHSFFPAPIALAALLALGASNAHADGGPTPGQVKGVPVQLTTAVSVLGVDYAVGTISYLVDAQTPLVDQATASTIGAANAKMLENYHSRMRSVRYGAAQLHGFINTAIVAGTAGGAATGVGAAVAIPAGVAAAKLNDMARDFLVANTQARASAALQVGLDRMNDEQRAVLDSLLKAGKYTEAGEHFNATTGLVSTMKATLAGDAAAQVLLDKSLTAAMAQGSVAAIRTSAATFDKVENLQEEFIDYTRRFADFGRKTGSALARLEASTQSLNIQITEVQGQLHDLAVETTANGAQIAIIQEVLFDQQPPGIKRAMLQSGALPGLTATQKAALLKTLDIQIQQQEIVSTVATVVGYARDLSTIMGAFGVKDPGLQKAVSYGSTAATALNQAFSGNYLGAVASVAGLFGGGSPPDPMAAHMKVIMEAFGEVNKKLDTVIELQRKTLEGIAALANDLSTIRRETHARFDRVDFELAQLRTGQQLIIWADLAQCARAVRDQDAHQVGIPEQEPRTSRYDRKSRRFVSYEAMFDYVRSNGDKLYQCAQFLDGIFATFREPGLLTGNPLSLAFAESKLGAEVGVPDAPPTTRTQDEEATEPANMALIEYDMPALAYYRRRLYDPSLLLFQSGWLNGFKNNPGWGGMANAYAMLTRPSDSVKILHDRMAALNTTSAANPSKPCSGPRTLLGRRLQDYLCTRTSVFDEASRSTAELAEADQLAAERAQAYLSQPILRDQIGQLADYALFVAGPLELVRDAGRQAPYTLAEVATRGTDRRGQALLLQALTVVDVAITQQSMLYGDMSAFFIADALWDDDAGRLRPPPKEEPALSVFDTAKRLLANPHNPWLRRNVAMVILKRAQHGCNAREQGDRCQKNTTVYELAYDKLFAIKNDTYAPVDADAVRVASLSFRRSLRLHHDVRFTVRDEEMPAPEAGATPQAGVRTLSFSVDGLELPMPSSAQWRAGALSYPPLMQARLADRERIGERLAAYAAFEGMDATQKVAYMTMLAMQPLGKIAK